MSKFLNIKNNKNKLFIHVRHKMGVAKIASKEIFFNGRNFFLTVRSGLGFC